MGWEEVYRLFGRAKDLDRYVRAEEDRRRGAYAERTVRDREEQKEKVEDIYHDPRSQKEISPIFPIIIEFNSEIKRWLAKHPEKIRNLTSREFEELVADLLKDFGFDVELTQATRDGGKDIYAYIKNEITSILMYVEAKKYTPPHKVGVDVVQRLYGVQHIQQANKCMIVTSSFFTKPAMDESKRIKNMMDLKDFNDLKKWLKKYE